MLLLASDSETPERAHALRRRVFTELLPPLLALVERRRCADTLLPGKCAPHEVDCARRYDIVAAGCAASDAALYGQYTGYEAYLKVARLALFWMDACREPSDFAPPTEAQTQQICRCLVTALRIMSAPRLQMIPGFDSEACFVVEVRRMMKDSAPFSGKQRKMVAAALERLTDSGVIEERALDDAMEDYARFCQQADAKAQADNEASGLQSCAHCGARELHVAQFKRCSACKVSRFCSKDCQLANWPAHKAACKAARKAAADAASSD